MFECAVLARLNPCESLSTEQCACIATDSLTLPSTMRSKPRRPCEPITIRSASHESAAASIARDGESFGSVTWRETRSPALVNNSAPLAADSVCVLLAAFGEFRQLFRSIVRETPR